MKIFIGCIILALGIGWFLTANDLAMTAVFSPAYEQVRRNTYERSASYNEGMWQELRNMQIDYIKADPDQKTALASVIKHRLGSYDFNKLPADLQQFYRSL